MKKAVLALAISTLATPALALDPIGDESGWSGFINLGGGFGSIETNFLSEVAGFDLGNDRIDDAGSPDDEDIGLPAGGFKVAYTFDSKKTQVLLGNTVLEPLAAELAVQLAVRHDFDKIGNVQLAGISTAGASTKQWSDPYQVGVKRGDTDSDSGGVRLTWDNMFGSNFEVDAIFRDRNIDDEDSGIALGLTRAERDLLDRQGDVTRVEAGYTFSLEGGKHELRPRLAYLDYDLDGDAMSQDGFEVGIGYTYTSSKVKWINNLSYASLDGDKTNPVFGDSNDADRYAVSSRLMFPGAFGWKKWVPTVGAVYADEDSDVDFNDTSIWLVSASLYRRF
ncbi:MAG: DUF2860 family protein [Halieaceae bacterium]